MNIVDRILLIEYLVSCLGSAIFVVRYSMAKWWRTAEGRAIMGLHAVLAMFGLLTLLRITYGLHYPGRAIFSLVAVTGLVVATWSLTLLLFRAQRRGKRPLLAQDDTDPDALEPVRD